MPDASDIADTIAQTGADGIANVTINGQSTTVLSIDEQIKAANYTAAQAASTRSFGLRFTQLVPPGCG